jgi:glycosidase
MFEFHVSRVAREKFDFDQTLFTFDGNVIFADFLAARNFAQKINQTRDVLNFPEMAVSAGDINAMGLIDEILHLVIALYRRNVDSQVMSEAFKTLEKALGEEKLEQALERFVRSFPPVAVYRNEISLEEFFTSATDGTPNKYIVLEELLLLWVTNRNPAVSSFAELFDDSELAQTTKYRQLIQSLQKFLKSKPYFGPDNQDLITMLRSPAIDSPHSLSGQLEYIRRKWGFLIGDYLYRLLNSIDLIREETKPAFSGPGPTLVPGFTSLEDDENFSQDSDWMPRTVMIAKNTYVWLFQLSKTYKREIKHLDQIPDEELDQLAGWGFNGLWLIGLWERSEASKRIKQLCGNPEAVASAYSLKNYSIANDLGGENAYQKLREKAWQRGIRLASDMVPNHMGIDSDWVLDHPEWFISLPHSPFPSYSFTGLDLSPVDRVSINIDDHYYDRMDAAVVFKHVDHERGETRYIYHGNDGTSMPWNDTAQLDYLNEEVLETVIQTILHVARKFPIIRFDAAMTLAKKHYQRLWFPQPGTGGAIPSRAEHGLTKDAFNRAFPKEFWREVVDRVAEEVPETLLLAEAFWMMEGFFVRTLGMHRVYNSAFMNMLRNEENSKYRQVIKNTLEFDPQILKRYVNFMNNPDEKTAVDQFGKGDKYFGICTLMATMPGLPMFGHGQIQGFAEKYGMEYYRPYWDETPDRYLVQRHQNDIFPLLQQRDLFSGIQNFLLFDFFVGEGRVNENVFAFVNGNHYQRALVIYNNHFSDTKGWIHSSASYLDKDAGHLDHQSLYDGLNLRGGKDQFVIFRDNASGLEFIRSSDEINQKGLFFELKAYEIHVFLDFKEVDENRFGQYAQLNAYLKGRGVPNVDNALKELMLAPILNPLSDLINSEHLRMIYQNRVVQPGKKLRENILSIQKEKHARFLDAVRSFVNMNIDIHPLVREQQKGLEAILQLPVFGEQYPFPSSKRYETIIQFIQQNLHDYPFIWYVLIMWNDLRLIGRVITHEPQYAEISRSWLEEWGMIRLVHQTLVTLGLDSQQAQSGVNILKLLVSHQNWVDNITSLTPLLLIESWLTHEDMRTFLDINRYRGKLWFNKESFESLMWWMMTTALIQWVSDPETSLAKVVENLFDAYAIIEVIMMAETDSEYQVENLLEALK